MYNQTKKKKITCPRCGRPTRVMVTPGETVLLRFPLWCDWCKCESVVNFGDESQRPGSPEPTA